MDEYLLLLRGREEIGIVAKAARETSFVRDMQGDLSDLFGMLRLLAVEVFGFHVNDPALK